MDPSWNQRVARAVWQAGLLPEAELHRALAEAGQEDLARFLARTGRVPPQALQKVLGSSASWPAVQPHAPTVVLPPAGPGHTPLQQSPTPGSQGGTVGQALKAAHGIGPGQLMPPGSRIGGFELRRLLGKGGMGAVFEADDARLARKVALKVLLAGEGASPEQLARFRAEAQAAGRLQHPHVVQVFEVGEAEGISFLALELVQGPSLRELIEREGPLPPRRALALVAQVARGVAAAHAQGIVHRDLKPHNVLVAPGDAAKVMDFGLAKATGEAAGAGLTVSGAIIGTPSYMSPEQASGEPVGPPADVYGLGAILYECLTGKAPFTGGSIPMLIHAVLNREVAPPRSLRPSLHRDVETICLKALAKRPEGRYASAEALAADIERWLAGEAIEARPPSLGERGLRWARRHRAVLVPGLVALVAVATVAIQPALAERRARQEREAALARARSFQERVAASLSELAALASSAGEEGPARVAARATALEAELRAAAPEPRASGPCLVAEPFLGAAWLVAGRSRAARGDAAGAQAAWGEAVIAAPEGPAALDALAELAAAREGPAAEELVRALLGQAGPSPDARASLLLARANQAARSMDLPGARAGLLELRGLSPQGPVASQAARLERLATALQGLLPLPREAAQGRFVRARAGPSPRIVSLDAAAGGAIWRPGPTGPIAEVELPPWPAGSLLAGEQLHQADGWQLPGGRVLRAACTSQRRLLLGFDRDPPRPLATSPSWPLGEPAGLAFVELDGDPATAELAWVVGPNEGDSRLAMVRADGRVDLGALDVRGRTRRAGAACYVNAWTAGPFGPGGEPALVLGYGAWYGQDLRRSTSNDPWNAAEVSPVIGTVRALEPFDLDGDGVAELIAGHVRGEEPDPAHVAPGLAAYAWGSGPEGFRRLWTLSDPPAAESWERQGVNQLVVLGTGRGEALALWTVTALQSPRLGFVGRWRAGLLRAGGAELLLDQPWTQKHEGWPFLGTLDWDGDGEDELLWRGGPTGLALLGTGSAEPPGRLVAPSGAPPGALWLLDQLDRLGLTAPAFQGLLRLEAARGPSGESEELAHRLLSRLREAGWERFAPAVAAFLEVPARGPMARARALLLRAEELARSDDRAMWERASDDLRQAPASLLPGPERSVRDRLEQVLETRAKGQRLEVDLTDPSRFPAFLASDPLRLRFDRERGLVALPTRRVGFLAGVPLVLPPGPIRLTLDLSVEGRTWGGLIEVGLLREVAAGIADRETVEGLTVGLGLWSTGDLRSARQSFSAGFGHSALQGSRGAILAPGSDEALGAGLGGPYLFRGRYRVVLEHHPESKWSRLVLFDLSRGERRILVQEGRSAQALPTGPFLAGVWSRIHERDFSGGNFAPEAEVALTRVVIEHDGEPEDGAPQLVPAGEGVSPARLAAGLHVLARGDRQRGARALQVYEQALAAAARPEQQAALLLQRAELRISALADPAAARADLEAALRTSPLGLFRALEDDGRLLPEELSRALCEALREGLRASPGEETADTLLRRAILHRLRGERAEAVAALERAARLEPGAAAEGLAWLATSLDHDLGRLEGFPRRPALPELDALLPAWWLPLEEPPGGLDALLAGKVRAARDAELLLWLDRAVMLRPSDPQPRWQRAQLLARVAGRDWQAVADLERAARLAPAEPALQLSLGNLRLLAFDWVGAGAALREAVRLGAGREVADLLAQLEQQVRFLAEDPRWRPFLAAVQGDGDGWSKFVDGL